MKRAMPVRTGGSALAALLVALAAGLVAAQVPQPPPIATPPPAAPAPAAAPAGLNDPAELEAFVDGVVAAQKESNKVAGMVVAVVRDGRLFFAKGYGMADRAAGRKVDAERTLFRVGSVSKLFTWTAVMQLVDQGRIDLMTDVNTYLAGSPVRVPERYSQPVTMTHLMTHTPGFEDVVVGLFGRSPASLRPLGTVLSEEMPGRVRPPGVLSAYSNHGTALAGYIVERVSGMPYEQYVEANILGPLGMSHTSVRQPLPKHLESDMAIGYKFEAGEYKPEPFEYVPATPAGAVSASAADMSRFMLAHLQEGRYGDARILSEATARRMRERLFGHVTALNGMLYGFIEMNRNGRRIYGHGGDTLWFHSELAMLPDEQVGLFVSCNSGDCGRPRSALVKALVDRYFPDQPAPTLSAGRLTEPPGTFAGSYRPIRMSYRSLAKVAGLVQALQVTELPDGRLRTSGMGNVRLWARAGPLLFRATDGDERMAFLIDSDGRVTHFAGDFPAIAFERLGPLQTPRVHYAIIGGSLFLLATAIVGWPIGGWLAWRRGRRAGGDGSLRRRPRFPRLVLWLAAVLLVAFVGVLSVALANPIELVYGVPPLLRSGLALPIAAAVLTGLSLVFAWMAWRRRYWRLWGRFYYALVALAAAALLAVLWYWNLLGYHLR